MSEEKTVVIDGKTYYLDGEEHAAGSDEYFISDQDVADLVQIRYKDGWWYNEAYSSGVKFAGLAFRYLYDRPPGTSVADEPDQAAKPYVEILVPSPTRVPIAKYENAAGDVSCEVSSEGFKLCIEDNETEGDNVGWLRSIAETILATIEEAEKQGVEL